MSSNRSNSDPPGNDTDPDRTAPGVDDKTEAMTGAPKPASGSGADNSLLGKSIGRYQIIDILGRGGMGTVYEAVQENPRRRVALKVINPGLASSELLTRFEHEAHILGKLNHPGIADIYESGTFDLGAGAQPYFAMELVQGETLIDYARHHGLDTRQRLTLIARICRAVLHAHQKGIIHRDLKPANIVVVDEPGGIRGARSPGQPKVLDFGVARATNADVQSATVQTEAGMLIGTFSYMSPEQAAGDPDELDTRSDVYSLGVIAYELLGGRLPYNLDKTKILKAIRVICEEPPTKLGAYDRKLRGDIEIIVDKALAKNKEERYQSALEFADDIERYLRSEPIVARRPSARYRLAKFARRNKVLVSSIVMVFLVLVGGVATATSLYLRAEAARAEAAAQRDRAERNALELERVSRFQAEQLSGIDVPSMAMGLRSGVLERVRLNAERRGLDIARIEARLTELRTMLEGVDFAGLALDSLDEYIFKGALEAIDRQFADQPLLQARLLQTVATTLRDLGELDRAAGPQERALSIRLELLSDGHPDALDSIHQKGNLLRAQGHYEEAASYLQRALAGRRDALGDDHPDTLKSLNDMGRLLEARGEHGEAEDYYRDALAGQRRVLGSTDPLTLNTISNLGLLLETRGEHAEAESYLREALEGYKRVLGDQHRYTLNALNNMGGLFWEKGEIDRAEGYWREALEGRRNALGNNHPDTLSSINNMGSLMRARGEAEEAEAYFKEVVERSRRVLGEDHPTTLTSVNNMATLLAGQGRLSEAEPYFRQALAAQRRLLGDDHPNTLIMMHNTAHVLRELERYDESVEIGEDLVAAAREALPADHPNLGTFLRGYALTLIELERFEEAEAVMLESHRIVSEAHGAEHDDTAAMMQTLVELYRAWHEVDATAGHDEQARQWQARLPQDDA